MQENETKSVLVIDDEKEILNIVKKMLGLFLANTDTAYDGKNALLKSDNNNYDLIITDILMPRMGGTDFIKKLKSGTRNKNTPIMVVSANLDGSVIAELKQLGVTQILTKPIDPGRFNNFILKHLKRAPIVEVDPDPYV
jgi:CheY-like chemotaxis protein